jgi:hypothetical protein
MNDTPFEGREHERLIEGEEDNKFDGEELGEWSFSFKFFFCETIE